MRYKLEMFVKEQKSVLILWASFYTSIGIM